MNPWSRRHEADEADVRIRLHPPRSPEAVAGLMQIGIVARRIQESGGEAGEVVAELAGRLRLEPFDELDAALDPIKAAGRRAGSYRLRAVNRGNHRRAGSRSSIRTRSSSSPPGPGVGLAPGEAAEVPVRAKARWRLVGGGVTRPFHVDLGRFVERPDRQLAGQFRHRALLPVWRACSSPRCWSPEWSRRRWRGLARTKARRRSRAARRPRRRRRRRRPRRRRQRTRANLRSRRRPRAPATRTRTRTRRTRRTRARTPIRAHVDGHADPDGEAQADPDGDRYTDGERLRVADHGTRRDGGGGGRGGDHRALGRRQRRPASDRDDRGREVHRGRRRLGLQGDDPVRVGRPAVVHARRARLAGQGVQA